MKTRDWKWIVSILSGIIVFLFSYKFWGKSGNLTEIISIGSGLASISLAVTAIIIAVAEGVKTSNKEIKVNEGLDSIVSNLSVMKKLISKLDTDNSKTHNQLSKLESYIKFYNEPQGLKESERTEQERTEQERTEQERTEQERVEQERVEQERKEQERKVQERVEQERTEQERSKPERTELEGVELEGVELEEKELEGTEHKEIESQVHKWKTNSTHNYKNVKRGDIFIAELSLIGEEEKSEMRPVVIIQNDIANRFSPTVTVAPLTTKIQKAKLPTHVEIDSSHYRFKIDSVILLEQIRTIDKIRLKGKITILNDNKMKEVEDALLIQLGMIKF